MNILPALQDRLSHLTLFPYQWVRLANNTSLELALKYPSDSDRRCIVLRIFQDDNILQLALINLTGHLPEYFAMHEEFDLLDEDYLDKLVAAIHKFAALSPWR